MLIGCNDYIKVNWYTTTSGDSYLDNYCNCCCCNCYCPYYKCSDYFEDEGRVLYS